MKYIEHYCPMCANVLGGFSENERIQLKDMKCYNCGNQIISTGKVLSDFWDYGSKNHVDLDEAIREIYVYNNPLFDKIKSDERVTKENAAQEIIDQIHRDLEVYRGDLYNPKCPNCRSTAITAGQRGFSIITGFWGSGNTVNRCAACGHKWKP